MSESNDAKPIRMTKAILDAGADFKKDVILENYGVPIIVTVRPLTEDEIEAINAKTLKPMDAMAVVKATGKSLKELRDCTPKEWEALISNAITDGKISTESFKAQSARYMELVRHGVLDDVIRENPEKLRFGSLSYLGNIIENMSMAAPSELEDFLRQSMGNGQQCSSPQDTNSLMEN